MRSSLALGLVAGAAGTAALNVVTYLDMALRGRAVSTMPAQAASRLAGAACVPLGQDESRDNRAEGVGALLGYATGLGWGRRTAGCAPRSTSLPPLRRSGWVWRRWPEATCR